MFSYIDVLLYWCSLILISWTILKNTVQAGWKIALRNAKFPPGKANPLASPLAYCVRQLEWLRNQLAECLTWLSERSEDVGWRWCVLVSVLSSTDNLTGYRAVYIHPRGPSPSVLLAYFPSGGFSCGLNPFTGPSGPCFLLVSQSNFTLWKLFKLLLTKPFLTFHC